MESGCHNRPVWDHPWHHLLWQAEEHRLNGYEWNSLAGIVAICWNVQEAIQTWRLISKATATMTRLTELELSCIGAVKCHHIIRLIGLGHSLSASNLPSNLQLWVALKNISMGTCSVRFFTEPVSSLFLLLPIKFTHYSLALYAAFQFKHNLPNVQPHFYHYGSNYQRPCRRCHYSPVACCPRPWVRSFCFSRNYFHLPNAYIIDPVNPRDLEVPWSLRAKLPAAHL